MNASLSKRASEGAPRGEGPPSRIPTFLFIGPDKSGSTWLYRVLQQHPDCFVPALKDLFFFDRYYDKGMEWYLSHFAKAPSHAKALGELSHDYLFSPLAADRILRHLPGVTLLSTLRDPVERTFSQYLFMIRSGWTRRTFEDALEHHPVLIENSLYGKHLTAYFDRFSREQIQVFYFDRLREDPQGFAGDVLGVLGLEAPADFDFGQPVLPASRPRWAPLNRALRKTSEVARWMGMTGLVARAKRTAAAGWLHVPYDPSDRPEPAADTVKKLRDRFAADRETLRSILPGPHPRWLADG